MFIIDNDINGARHRAHTLTKLQRGVSTQPGAVRPLRALYGVSRDGPNSLFVTQTTKAPISFGAVTRRSGHLLIRTRTIINRNGRRIALIRIHTGISIRQSFISRNVTSNILRSKLSSRNQRRRLTTTRARILTLRSTILTGTDILRTRMTAHLLRLANGQSRLIQTLRHLAVRRNRLARRITDLHQIHTHRHDSHISHIRRGIQISLDLRDLCLNLYHGFNLAIRLINERLHQRRLTGTAHSNGLTTVSINQQTVMRLSNTIKTILRIRQRRSTTARDTKRLKKHVIALTSYLRRPRLATLRRLRHNNHIGKTTEQRIHNGHTLMNGRTLHIYRNSNSNNYLKGRRTTGILTTLPNGTETRRIRHL